MLVNSPTNCKDILSERRRITMLLMVWLLSPQMFIVRHIMCALLWWTWTRRTREQPHQPHLVICNIITDNDSLSVSSSIEGALKLEDTLDKNAEHKDIISEYPSPVSPVLPSQYYFVFVFPALTRGNCCSCTQYTSSACLSLCILLPLLAVFNLLI